MKILIVANCAGQAIRRFLLATERIEAEHHVMGNFDHALLTSEYLAQFDAVIAQETRPDLTDLWDRINSHPRVLRFPLLFFFGFTPDHGALITPATDNVSRIMSSAWSRGLTSDQTRALFNPEFLQAMHYYSEFGIHRQIFIEMLNKYTDRGTALFENWFDRGVFFYTGNHPKSFVIEDILHDVLMRNDLDLRLPRMADILQDPLKMHGAIPHLNHPHGTNLLSSQSQLYKLGEQVFTLDRMVDMTFRQLADMPETPVINPAYLTRFDAAYAAWTGRAPQPTINPYAGRPDWAFWSRMVARPAPAAVSPGTGLRPVITPETRVATAGSCFAQHVARAMVQGGLTYHVTETPPEGMDAETAEAQGYGLFSARYGNIYSTRQLLQLIRRAYGRFTPIETAWPVEGGFVDPFRPNIGETFASVEAVEAARADHLAQVRRMFETLDVFVFTLGLTEGWVDRRDGAAYPVTPGSVTRGANPAHFAFVNQDSTAVRADLLAFVSELAAVNPTAQVILTVSPVPLIATYGHDDVLTATTWSKSVLRTAAGEVAARCDNVQYFPSYEIITGGFNRGAYFNDDLRGIRPEGVAHVMRVFHKRLVIEGTAATEEAAPPPTDTSEAEDAASRAEIAGELTRQMKVICDEELQVRDL